MSLEINWIVVGLRLADGFLYGTGFMLAVVLWYGVILKVGKKTQQ